MCLADERGGYAHLLDLCETWAVEANAPKELILRRVIEWAVEETFPPESLLTYTGDAVSPLKLLTMFRATYNPWHEAWPVHVAPTTIGSRTERIHPDKALSYLANVVVSLEGVQLFRDRLGIAPSDPPPACPHIAEVEAADFAPPATAEVKGGTTPSTSYAERRCEEWLEGLMAGGRKPVKAKPAYREDAMALFKGLSVNGFNRAWGKAIATTNSEQWSKRGRKS